MKISKNISRGELITDCNEIIRLARERKSVVVNYATKIHIVRPAAFVIHWPLAMIINKKIYYSIHEN